MKSPIYLLQDVIKKRSKGGVDFTLLVPELTIFRGEFLAVVGPSGCGKSTLLDILALVLAPGSCTRFDIDIDLEGELKRYEVGVLSENEIAGIRGRHIGYVLQNGGLLPFLTVRENILLTATISKTKGALDKCAGLADRLGLTDQLDKKPQHLSGGQRQRAAVARALIHHPAIILADEPTAAVDYPTALDIRDELKELAHQMGSAVIMVTHDHSLVEGVADAEVQFTLTRKSLTDTRATISVQRGRTVCKAEDKKRITPQVQPA